jgi:putative tryptophan/tyrosine transport system substrate-binding protein
MSFFLVCCVSNGYAQEILVVRSMKIKPYAEAFSGFRAALSTRFPDLKYSFVDGSDSVPDFSERKPDLLVAIGMDALRKVTKIQDVPILSLMVLNPVTVPGGERIAAGVSMTIAPEKQLAAIRKVFPAGRRIGLVFDPRRSGAFVKRAQRHAREMRFELVLREVSEPRFVADALNGLKGVVDVLWMIPDTTVVTPETVELMMLYSLENRLPVCTFSIKYLAMGAFMSLDINAYEMGKQAGILAAKILSGSRLPEMTLVDADSFSVTINESVARKLRIPVSDEVRGMARVVR